MTLLDLLVIVPAGFLAGMLNTVAGGGSFLTFPALVLIGVPPVAANATSAVAVFPGYLAGAFGFGPELRSQPRRRLARLIGVSLAGGATGGLLLLLSSDAAFSALVPFLLLGATLAFLFGERLRAWAAARGGEVTPYGSLGLFLVCAYGGYFNGGLGIVLLALFALWGLRDMHLMNGLKVLLSFTLAAISVAIFALAGLVAWPEAVVMALAGTIGGYAGAPVARRLPMPVLRGIVVGVGFVMTALFLWRLV